MKAKLLSQVYHDERVELQKHIPLTTPLVVYIEASGYCNLQCAFCPHGSKEKTFKKDFMSVKLFKKLINDLSAFPDKIKLLRFCGNGDSLMNKDIVKMTQYAKEQKIAQKMEMITNGTLLTTDLIKNLPRFLDRIICSLEGLSADDYQRICNTKINFQNLLNNSAALYACKGKCKIHIKIHNEAVSSESKKTMFFNMFSGLCDEIYIENLVPMWPQFNTAYSTNEFRFGGGATKRQVCPQIFKSVQVQADGEILPCCVDWRRVNVLGNINKNSLFEIWNGEKLRKLQMEHLKGNKSKIQPCKDCTMNDYCEVDNIDSYAEKCMQRLCR
jgi:radical SAM protein with 4Fe4S-binding SPASM domain